MADNQYNAKYSIHHVICLLIWVQCQDLILKM